MVNLNCNSIKMTENTCFNCPFMGKRLNWKWNETIEMTKLLEKQFYLEKSGQYESVTLSIQMRFKCAQRAKLKICRCWGFRIRHDANMIQKTKMEQNMFKRWPNEWQLSENDK